MPVMDGLALIKQIKATIEICHIPIILLTANNSDEARKTGYGLGADAYISKPFDNELLLAQADRLIKNRELIRDKYKSQNFMVEVESNSSKDNDFVQNVKNIFEQHIINPEFNVSQLSQLLNISTTQLYRRLKHLTGHTPVEFIRLIRLQKAHALLSGGKNTVKEVCYLTGFNNLSYFIKCFKEQFGVTPANFRDSGQHNDSD
jgi:AraC-like DNA-binding protein